MNADIMRFLRKLSSGSKVKSAWRGQRGSNGARGPEWMARYHAGDAAGVAWLHDEQGYQASAHIFARGREAIERYLARRDRSGWRH